MKVAKLLERFMLIWFTQLTPAINRWFTVLKKCLKELELKTLQGKRIAYSLVFQIN